MIKTIKGLKREVNERAYRGVKLWVEDFDEYEYFKQHLYAYFKDN
jgi:hypothetical protein